MKPYIRLVLAVSLACAVLLVGCAGAQPAAPLPTPLPTIASSESSSASVTASAVVAPVEASEMAFTLSAPVNAVTVREGDQVITGQTLMVLDTPALEYAVTESQAALQAAQIEAELQRYSHKVWNGSKFVYLSGPPELRQVADAKVVQAQAALEVAQAALAESTLAAPFDGTVVKVNFATGELVQPNQAALVIADLTHLQVETTDLSERQIAGVKIGQAAGVHIEALNQDFNGQVAAIVPLAAQYNGDRVFKVTIALDQQPQQLMWGMNADVEIQTAQ
jgi:membrane fusion protein (multidrug efflux system)